MYLFDSDTCIEMLRGRMPGTVSLMRGSQSDLFGVPTVVEAELRLGAARSDNPEANRLLLERFLAPLAAVPFTSACAIAYAEIRADLQARGCLIGPNDLFIAATAKATGSVLVSNNVREFSRVRGLSLESWCEMSLDEAVPS